jgi:hypothetical protein
MISVDKSCIDNYDLNESHLKNFLFFSGQQHAPEVAESPAELVVCTADWTWPIGLGERHLPGLAFARAPKTTTSNFPCLEPDSCLTALPKST